MPLGRVDLVTAEGIDDRRGVYARSSGIFRGLSAVGMQVDDLAGSATGGYQMRDVIERLESAQFHCWRA